jgi:hypothetical protein
MLASPTLVPTLKGQGGDNTGLVPILFKFGYKGHICLVLAKNLRGNTRTRPMLGSSLTLLRTFGSSFLKFFRSSKLLVLNFVIFLESKEPLVLDFVNF